MEDVSYHVNETKARREQRQPPTRSMVAVTDAMKPGPRSTG